MHHSLGFPGLASTPFFTLTPLIASHDPSWATLLGPVQKLPLSLNPSLTDQPFLALGKGDTPHPHTEHKKPLPTMAGVPAGEPRAGSLLSLSCIFLFYDMRGITVTSELLPEGQGWFM